MNLPWWLLLLPLTLGQSLDLEVDLEEMTVIAEPEVEEMYPVKWMQEKGNLVHVKEENYENLQIFCHKGLPLSVLRFWSSVVFRLQISGDKFEVFKGSNSSAVVKAYEDHQAVWLRPTGFWKTKDIRVNPFVDSCAGVLTASQYDILLHVYRVNYWQVVMTLTGVLLYFYAPRMCRNVVLHYTTGVFTGVLLSLLVITYFIQKKLRSNVYGWIFGVYSVSLYVLSSLWFNIQQYMQEYHVYILGYIVMAGVISFAACYRMGPVENPRTLNLIQWTLQSVGLLLIYLSSNYQAASLTLALIILSWASIPDRTKSKAQSWYKKRFFRPQIKLLSESEYMDQSRVETEKALKELRSFCRSPECDAWKYTTRLHSPTRFAQFVEGAPHLTEDEVMDYSHMDYEDLGEEGAHLMTDDEEEEELDGQ